MTFRTLADRKDKGKKKKKPGRGVNCSWGKVPRSTSDLPIF